MFAIKTVQIYDNQCEILKVCLSEPESKNLLCHNYMTLVLGENGVGKSFLLKSIIDIFRFLEAALDSSRKRKPRYQYESFYIEYWLGKDFYSVHRVSGSQIIATKNGEEISYKEIVLPQKVLAISFMVNDKFQYTKDEDDGIYTYHGVRSSTNATYTSSIARNIVFDLIHCIRNGLFRQLVEIFSILQFDSVIEFEWKNKESIERETVDLRKNEVYFTNISEFNNWVYPDVYFFKNNQKISFDSCSSGEKHILFAYVGILRRICSNTLILIDEPEISLHPEWQIRYISTLSKLFSEYENCCFILASHSHYFVSELQGDCSTIVVLRKEFLRNAPRAEVIPFDTYSWSAENIIYNVFGIRTSRNYYFESDLSYLISSLESFDGSDAKRDSIQMQIAKLRRYVFDANDPLYMILKEAEDKIK